MSMTNDETRVYRKWRTENPAMPMPAKYALKIAKYHPPEMDWHSDTHGDYIATVDRPPFTVKVKIVSDEEMQEVGEISDTPLEGGIRFDRFDYYNRIDGGEKYKWWLPESGETLPSLAKAYNKAGMSRSVAWEAALASLRDELDATLGDRYGWFGVTATAYLNGDEVGSDSVWGYQMVYGDEHEMNTALDEHGLIDAALDDARKEAPELLVKAEAQVSALRAVLA